MPRVLLPLVMSLIVAGGASAAEPLTGCGTVGRGADAHTVAKRGPVSCRQARRVVRRRAIEGRRVPGWRCTRDAQGLIRGWRCRAGERVVIGNERSETP